MTLGGIIVHLAPEWILTVGACAVLIVGLVGREPGAFSAPFSFLCVALALIVSLGLDSPSGEVVPGLLLTPLTYYARIVALGLGTVIILVNWRQPDANERGEYFSKILFSLLGVLLTASANDLVVLFFAVELVSIPTYVLVALSREDARASEAAVKYFFLGALSAALLVLGLVFLYGESGTTTMFRAAEGGAAVALARAAQPSALATVGLVLILAGLSFKIAAVPFHAYVADVYEGAAAPVAGMLGFVPKFAGFVALAQVFAAVGWHLPGEMLWLLWALAALTMTVGNLLALMQRSVKRMLAYSSIAHSGYMLVALLAGPVAGLGPMRDGVAAMLFYIAVYGAMNLGAFALLACVRKDDGEAETLDDIAGLSGTSPGIALGMAICAFSLMGLPPTAGFLGKLYVFSSAFSLPDWHPMQKALIVLGVIGVINSAIGAAYYLRIVAAMYIGGRQRQTAQGGGMARVGLGLCALAMVVLFLWPAGLTRQASSATLSIRKSARTDSGRLTSSEESQSPLKRAGE